MKVTRTVKRFRATAVKANIKERTFESVGEVEFSGTHATATIARKAFADNGMKIAKGTQIEIEEVGSVTYACELEDFISISHVISEADAQAIESE